MTCDALPLDNLSSSPNMEPNSRGLEKDLERELNLSWRVRATDRAKGRIGEVRVGLTEIRAVQNVEELRPELHFCALPHWNWNGLLQRDVHLPEAGRTESISTQ